MFHSLRRALGHRVNSVVHWPNGLWMFKFDKALCWLPWFICGGAIYQLRSRKMNSRPKNANLSRDVKLSVKPTVWIIRVGRGGKNPPRLDYTSRETFHLFRQTGLRPRENNTEGFHTLFPVCGVRFMPRNNIYSHSFSFVFLCFLHRLRGQSDVFALRMKAFIDTGCMLKLKTYFNGKGTYVLCFINSSTCIFVYAIFHST